MPLTGFFAVLTLLLPTTGAQSAPQAPAPTTPRSALQASFALVRKTTMSMVELMPEAGYASRVSEPARSFGEVVGHMIDTNFGVCAGARKIDNPRKGQPAEGVL